MIPVVIENPSSFTIKTGLIECACGNMMHISMKECGECLEDGFAIEWQNQRSFALARRSFVSGY